MGGKFRPVRNYGKNNSNHWLKYKRNSSWWVIFANIITAERDLRQLVQRQERLQAKLSRLDKDEQSNIKQSEKEIGALQREILLQEYTLYEREGKIPNGPMQQAYDSLRRNPRWHCQPELVDQSSTRTVSQQ